ncbi:cupin [Niallia circulans]|uniref:Cupin n=1 Tax=Niallia circulans TaxID=1397 RepID=A0A553SNL2_NIACI|nr:cupin [Niallia circulans]TRZ38580.1 cupin [Niallia circulans]
MKKIISFNKLAGKEIGNYQSMSAYYTKIMRTDEPVSIGIIHIESGGVVGYHNAPVSQAFIVMEGKGWIKGPDKLVQTIQSGEGVLWEKGEGHESGSEEGMTVLVLQGENLPLEERV